MTDRELLEAAAKAAGLEFGSKRSQPLSPALYLGPSGGWWNPLTDDGDALRLAVKLRLQVAPGNGMHEDLVEAYVNSSLLGRYPPGSAEKHNGDPLAATRRAIVRAAAEIGKGMK